MNILIISATYPPASGGVATHVADLTHGLVKRRHRVTVITNSKNENSSVDGRGGLRVYKLGRRSVPEFDGRRVHGSAILNTILSRWIEIRPDIIHLHDFDSLFAGWMLWIAHRIPLVLTVHRAPSPWRHLRYRENAKDCFMEAAKEANILSGIVTPSKCSAAVLKTQGFGINGNAARLHVIPHGTRPFLAQVADDPTVIEDLRLRGDRFIVLCPSRADEHKDTAVFIAAAALLQQRRPDVHWHFILNSQDDDPLYDRNLAYAHDVGLEPGRNIIFQKLLFKQMATLFRRTAICVVPSRHESFGLSVLESFLFKVPVIVANASGLAELVVNRSNGLLFTDGSVEELAQQIDTLQRDPHLRRQLASAGSILVKPGGEFNSDRMVERYAAFYRTLVDGVE
jgi:glycosyltransferase involved in cell wall biosynthesis